MTQRIAFVDPLAPRAYSGAPGGLAGLGGTEATLVRIAESLAATGSVAVHQRARHGGTERVRGVDYDRYDSGMPLREHPHTIVVVNSWKVALKLARLHPDASIVVWLHVFPGRHNRVMGPLLRQAGIEVVCVSRTHARWVRSFLGSDSPVVGHICNPIPDELRPDATPRDPDLLLFASSPHKGLEQVYRRFAEVRGRWPSLRLAVADPGYLPWPSGEVPEGVMQLGRLDQGALIGWMRRALCLFYPQDRFAETFGLVIAEANAVGCPALVHRGLGANDEVVSDPEQCIDASDPEVIAERIATWRDPALRPVPRARPDFHLSAVTRSWAALTARTSRSERSRRFSSDVHDLALKGAMR